MVGGGKLIIAVPGGEKDTQYLARLCRQHGVTACLFVPSQLDAALHVRPWPLRLLICPAAPRWALEFKHSVGIECNAHRSLIYGSAPRCES